MTSSRCSWCEGDPLYRDYHDREWGVPERDDRALFEKLVLDGFQAGLSWLIILKKREGFRRAFDGFDPAIIARYSERKLAALAGNAEIVRNRRKIVATRKNARAFLQLQEELSFAEYLWGFVGGETIHHRYRSWRQIPAETRHSRAMARDLAQRGFSFCGPTICYAFMQAVGMVNDHVVTCFRHPELEALS